MLGLAEAELPSLLAHVERHLDADGCDHSLRAARGWAARSGRSSETVAAALAELGGYCDCEVVANVTPDRFGWPD